MPDLPVLLSKPSTLPQPKCRLAGLDGLRALAIIAVLLNHFLQSLVPTSFFERAPPRPLPKRLGHCRLPHTLGLPGRLLSLQTKPLHLEGGPALSRPPRLARPAPLLRDPRSHPPTAAAPLAPRRLFARHPLLAPAFPLAALLQPRHRPARPVALLRRPDQSRSPLDRLAPGAIRTPRRSRRLPAPATCPTLALIPAAGHRCPHCAPRHVSAQATPA